MDVSRQQDELPKAAVIKNSDMDVELQQFAVDVTARAMRLHMLEKDVAAVIKKEFDAKWGPLWHCMVGRVFG
ncbi:hypothetical protein Ciccas_013665, partial [Cichlidogyrus casuarinus]